MEYLKNYDYERIKPGHPAYKMLIEAKKVGIEYCDSIDHNHNNGCSNPNCFKFNKRGKKSESTEV